jgi:hypothetical protein
MYLDPDDFDDVVQAMKSGFSSPTSDKTEVITTKAGVPFKDRAVWWKRKDGVVVANRYSSTVTRSAIRFSTKLYYSEFEKRQGARQKARARDL